MSFLLHLFYVCVCMCLCVSQRTCRSQFCSSIMWVLESILRSAGRLPSTCTNGSTSPGPNLYFLIIKRRYFSLSVIFCFKNERMKQGSWACCYFLSMTTLEMQPKDSHTLIKAPLLAYSPNLYFLRQALTKSPRLTLNSLSNWGWPSIYNLSASTSQGTGITSLYFQDQHIRHFIHLFFPCYCESSRKVCTTIQNFPLIAHKYASMQMTTCWVNILALGQHAFYKCYKKELNLTPTN